MDLVTVWAIAIKDLRQFFRDRVLMLFMILMPVLQLVLLAQATSSRIRDVPIAVIDRDHSAESRSLTILLLCVR